MGRFDVKNKEKEPLHANKIGKVFDSRKTLDYAKQQRNYPRALTDM